MKITMTITTSALPSGPTTGETRSMSMCSELSAARGLKLRAEQLRVAINETFGDWSQPLEEGDRVVFLPPVAGG